MPGRKPGRTQSSHIIKKIYLLTAGLSNLFHQFFPVFFESAAGGKQCSQVLSGAACKAQGLPQIHLSVIQGSSDYNPGNSGIGKRDQALYILDRGDPS